MVINPISNPIGNPIGGVYIIYTHHTIPHRATFDLDPPSNANINPAGTRAGKKKG